MTPFRFDLAPFENPFVDFSPLDRYANLLRIHWVAATSTRDNAAFLAACVKDFELAEDLNAEHLQAAADAGMELLLLERQRLGLLERFAPWATTKRHRRLFERVVQDVRTLVAALAAACGAAPV